MYKCELEFVFTINSGKSGVTIIITRVNFHTERLSIFADTAE